MDKTKKTCGFVWLARDTREIKREDGAFFVPPFPLFFALGISWVSFDLLIKYLLEFLSFHFLYNHFWMGLLLLVAFSWMAVGDE